MQYTQAEFICSSETLNPPSCLVTAISCPLANEVQTVVDFWSCKGKQNCSIRLLRKASFVIVNYFGHCLLLRRKKEREQGIMLCEQVRLNQPDGFMVSYISQKKRRRRKGALIPGNLIICLYQLEGLLNMSKMSTKFSAGVTADF